MVVARVGLGRSGVSSQQSTQQVFGALRGLSFHHINLSPCPSQSLQARRMLHQQLRARSHSPQQRAFHAHSRCIHAFWTRPKTQRAAPRSRPASPATPGASAARTAERRQRAVDTAKDASPRPATTATAPSTATRDPVPAPRIAATVVLRPVAAETVRAHPNPATYRLTFPHFRRTELPGCVSVEPEEIPAQRTA